MCIIDQCNNSAVNHHGFKPVIQVIMGIYHGTIVIVYGVFVMRKLIFSAIFNYGPFAVQYYQLLSQINVDSFSKMKN